MKRAATAFGLALAAGLFLAPSPASFAGSYGDHGAKTKSSKQGRHARKADGKDHQRCHRGLYGVRVCDKDGPHRHFGPYDYDYAIGKGYHILR